MPQFANFVNGVELNHLGKVHKSALIARVLREAEAKGLEPSPGEVLREARQRANAAPVACRSGLQFTSRDYRNAVRRIERLSRPVPGTDTDPATAVADIPFPPSTPATGPTPAPTTPPPPPPLLNSSQEAARPGQGVLPQVGTPSEAKAVVLCAALRLLEACDGGVGAANEAVATAYHVWSWMQSR